MTLGTMSFGGVGMFHHLGASTSRSTPRSTCSHKMTAAERLSAADLSLIEPHLTDT
jgi:hypothetical protein